MFRFTGKEIRDLIISFIVIALGFTILYSNGDYSHITLIFPIVGWLVCYKYIFKSKLNTVTQYHDDYILPLASIATPILFGLIFAPFLAPAPNTDFINLCKNIFAFILTYLHSFTMLVYINHRFKK